jgi:PAS domain S-box-containing protein
MTPPHVLEQWKASIAAGEPFEMTFPLRGTDGVFRLFLTRVMPQKSEQGRVLQWFGTNTDVDELKRAEAALRDSETRTRLATEATAVGIWEWNVLTNTTRWDAQMFRLYGIAPTADGIMHYSDWSGAVLPEDLAENERILQDTVSTCGQSRREFRVRRRGDGQIRDIEAVETVRTNAQGKAEWVVGTNLDVTDRKRAEDAVRASEERSAFVRRSSGVGFWYCDLPFDELQWDELVKAHFHLPPDAAVTIQTFYNRIHPDDREPTRQAIERSIAERTPYNMYYRTVNSESGALTWVRAIGRTFYAADGTPTRFDGVTLDVSDQKRAEASLRESEQRFRLVADAAPVLIWLAGTDRLCYWFNQPWLAFTGRSMDLELGNGWAEGVHPDDFDRCLQTYVAAFDARASFSMEYRLRRHDGEFRWLIDNGVPRYSSGGEFEGYIGSCLDVTDYKNAEAGLRDADRRKDEFLATLAHELRNPLAPIRNGLQLMKLAGGQAATVEQARSMMERQLTQMVRLVDDLMDVSRITRGKLELRKERVPLAAILSSAVETSRPLIEQMGHALTVTLPKQPLIVDADMTRLAQVFLNLLNNAAKYADQGGHIQLNVERQGSDVVVTVKDTGIGIAVDQLPRIFEMFTQVDQSLEKSQGGLGIGLTLVKRLVEMHGGRVEAKSEGPGKGSEFVVRLPVVFEASKPQESGSEEQSAAPKSSLRILIVDDNRDGADSLAMLLRTIGNDTRTAYDGQEGVDLAGQFRPEVLLLDIGLPKLSGYEACRRIREQSWGKGIVLIAVTGWGQENDRRRSHEAGFDHHMVKPVDPQGLMHLLAGLRSAKT